MIQRQENYENAWGMLEGRWWKCPRTATNTLYSWEVYFLTDTPSVYHPHIAYSQPTSSQYCKTGFARWRNYCCWCSQLLLLMLTGYWQKYQPLSTSRECLNKDKGTWKLTMWWRLLKCVIRQQLIHHSYAKYHDNWGMTVDWKHRMKSQKASRNSLSHHIGNLAWRTIDMNQVLYLVFNHIRHMLMIT